eukprot:Lithocolla_globosa_v1_NODE_537_length_3794_cov_22.651976.p3 type:complete len:102 gc:universal NODE_537_length_3794_cov_22.651976:1180-1485(+)
MVYPSQSELTSSMLLTIADEIFGVLLDYANVEGNYPGASKDVCSSCSILSRDDQKRCFVSRFKQVQEEVCLCDLFPSKSEYSTMTRSSLPSPLKRAKFSGL